MLLDAAGADPVHVPAYPVRVRDVSGAGDTVVAAFATLMAARLDLDPSWFHASITPDHERQQLALNDGSTNVSDRTTCP